MSLVRNERAKLTANLLNTLSGGCALGGVIAPTASAIYGMGVFGAPAWAGSLAGLRCSCASLLLHIGARGILGTVKQ